MIERNITRKAFPKMLVGLFVALFGDYGEYERWNSNAHTSGFGVRLPHCKFCESRVLVIQIWNISKTCQ